MRTMGLFEADQHRLASLPLRFSSSGEPTNTDYSEEAIPERDAAYRGFDGTLHEEQTVDDVPADVRRALARRLEQLGMSAARAAMVASL